MELERAASPCGALYAHRYGGRDWPRPFRKEAAHSAFVLRLQDLAFLATQNQVGYEVIETPAG